MQGAFLFRGSGGRNWSIWSRIVSKNDWNRDPEGKLLAARQIPKNKIVVCFVELQAFGLKYVRTI